MNTQALANRIVDDLKRMPAGTYGRYSLMAEIVKTHLDKAMAESKVPTQNKHPVKVPAVPTRPVFDHTRPEGLGVLAQSKFAFGHIPSEHRCEHCREYDLDGCPNCPGFQEY